LAKIDTGSGVERDKKIDGKEAFDMLMVMLVRCRVRCIQGAFQRRGENFGGQTLWIRWP
jgi:hypothetical protein